MPASYSVNTEITGRGNLAEVAKRATAALRGMVAPINAVTAAANKPATTALGRVGTMADNVAGRFRGGLSSITAWLPALGALGAAASLGGLVAMTRANAEFFDGMTKTAEVVGYAVAGLAALRYSAKLANVEHQGLEKGLIKLNKAMYDAATGKNKDVAALFQRMRIPLRNAKGDVKGASESLEDIAEAFKNTENPATRTAMAVALFGKAGADLLPLLTQGRAGIRAQAAEFRRLYGDVERYGPALERLDDSYDRLGAAGAGLSARLSGALAPALSRVVDGTTNWIVANRELIAQALERKIEKMGRAIEIVSGAGATLLAVPWVAELVKGADASTLFDIGLAGLGLTMAGPVLSAVQMVTLAVWRMNAAMFANPWVLLVAAIAYSAYSVYRHWGDIGTWWAESMDSIRAASDRGFGAEVWEAYKIGMSILPKAVSTMVKDLTGVDLAAIATAWMKAMIGAIEALLPDLGVAWKKLDPVFNWVSRNTTALPTSVPSGYENTAANYQKAYGGGPAPGVDPLARSVNAAAMPLDVKVIVDFLNTPQGARVEMQSNRPVKFEQNVGYSMVPNI